MRLEAEFVKAAQGAAARSKCKTNNLNVPNRTVIPPLLEMNGEKCEKINVTELILPAN